MKKILTWGCLILMAMACSKSDPVAPAGGCSVSFKGTTYTFNVVVCLDATSGSTEDGLSATDAGGTISFIIGRDSADPTANFVSLNTDISDMSGNSIYTAVATLTSQPTITRTGKDWTFSGTAMNGLADSGAISGTCTCTN